MFVTMLKALMGRGWADTYTYEGVTVRFGFDSVRTSQTRTDCQKQGNGNAP